MLIVISPAKTLDYATPVRMRKFTEPEFIDQAGDLIALMRRKKPAEISKLMGISPKLAELNHARYAAWSPQNSRDNARQALLAFMGDVYTGLDANTLSAADISVAQQRLRILSGLYGLLRPLDLMQPYRLEMGIPLDNPRGKNLYRFWGEQPTLALNRQTAALRTHYVVNLASNEYFKAVDGDRLEAEVITPVFKERQADGYKVLSFHAKKARGMMARYIIQNRIRKPSRLRDFAEHGYSYNAALSGPAQFVFTRE
jgi:cytoplasmic iron level regulating protein YaaA (DUF328/UPF0246 family)